MVFYGANDACLPGSDSGQHVPLDIYKENLKNIIQHSAVVVQRPRLILVTPPPVDEYKLEIFDAAKGITGVRRTAEHTRLYAEACKEVGIALSIEVLDVWSIFMEKAGWDRCSVKPLPGSKKCSPNGTLDMLLSDGLHFNPAAYQILFDSTMLLLKSQWPEEDPNKIELLHPL
ncbi:MAG: hypothetical protein Q9167_001855 [Letrouitia subvulpina]